MRARATQVLLGVTCLLGAAAAAFEGSAQMRAASLDRLTRALVAVQEWVASPARADEMKFTPLPPESSSSLEHSGRRASRGHASSGEAAPVPPTAPAPPTPPSPPTVIVGKSGDIMRVGSDIEIGRDEVVTGDVLAVGGDLRVQGHVEGNAVSVGGDIYLDSTARVDGDVVCMGGELHEDPGAVVSGKRVVGLGRNRERILSAPLRHRTFDVDVERGNRVARSLAWLLIWLLLGWVVVKITPGRTQAAVDSFRQSGGGAFLVGWLAVVLLIPGLIAVALLTALLCITIIGIPLGIALLFAYFLLVAVFGVWGGVVGAAVLGERLAVRQGQMHPTLMRATMIGVLSLGGALFVASVMKAIHFIPLFSGFGQLFHVLLIVFTILVGVTGWGALLRSEFTTGPIARWWHGRRGPAVGPGPGSPAPAPPGPYAPPPGPAGTVVTTLDTAAPPPPPPPSPPESFMPPRPPREPEPPAPAI